MTLRASSVGSGGSIRISSVSQSSSTASSRRRVRRELSGSSSSAATRRSLSIVERRATSVGCAVKTGRSATCRRISSNLVAVHAGLGDPRDGPLDPAAFLLALSGCSVAAAVHLLGDVGQVEVRRERPHQPGDRGQVEVGQLVEAALLGVRTHTLDQDEQLVSLGPGQCLAEDRGHATDVAAQLSVG